MAFPLLVPRNITAAGRRSASTFTSRRTRLAVATKRYSSTAASTEQKPKLCVVDLRGAGWSVLERLCVEEFLATKTKQNNPETTATDGGLSWLIIGTHEPTDHRHLRVTQKAPAYIAKSVLEATADGDVSYNPSCTILTHYSTDDKKTSTAETAASSSLTTTGESSGKYSELNLSLVVKDGILCLESSSPSFVGESVVLDHSSIMATLITASADHATVDFATNNIWGPTFATLEDFRLEQPEDSPTTISSGNSSSRLTMVLDNKSCSTGDNGGKMVSLEDLGITDTKTSATEDASSSPDNLNFTKRALPLVFQSPHYYRLGVFPVGLTQADHNTKMVRSIFWWDYDEDNFSYLSNPPPNSITDEGGEMIHPSLLKLQDIYPTNMSHFTDTLQQELRERFDVSHMTSRDVLRLMSQEKTGLQEWYDRNSSWKIVRQF